MSYATPADLVPDWMAQGAVPTDAQVRLNRASEDVAYALRLSVYQVDGGGVATDPKIIAAIVQAECATMAYRLGNGQDAEGNARQASEVAIGSVRIKRGSGLAGAGSGTAPSGSGIPPRAAAILMAAGLGPQVWQY